MASFEIGSASSIIGVIISTEVGVATAESEVSVVGSDSGGVASALVGLAAAAVSSREVTSLGVVSEGGSCDACGGCVSSGEETRTRGREGVWL